MTSKEIEMLLAYDEDNSRKDLLELAEKICNWLINEDDKNPIHILNLYQCFLRYRMLSNDEIDVLETLLNDTEATDNFKAGIYILLGNYRMANRYIDKLPKDQKNEFIKYPICHLLKES